MLSAYLRNVRYSYAFRLYDWRFGVLCLLSCLQMVENVCQQVRMMLIIVIFVLVENKTVLFALISRLLVPVCRVVAMTVRCFQ